MPTVIICCVLLIIVVFSVRSYLKKLSTGCCGGGDAVQRIKVKDRNADHYPYEADLQIGGMSCRNCQIRVENALNSLDGVWATVDLSAGKATVRCKTQPDEDTLRKAVTGVGYSVRSYTRAS